MIRLTPTLGRMIRRRNELIRLGLFRARHDPHTPPDQNAWALVLSDVLVFLGDASNAAFQRTAREARVTIDDTFAVVAVPAVADDSTAELATGGLAFVQTNDITMQSEDLHVSMAAIKARYEFVSTSDHDVTTLVAFPLPDIKGDPDLNVAVPTEDPVNFVGFKTVVDGSPVTTQVQQRVSALGVDQTALLKSLGVPLAPQLATTSNALDTFPHDSWNQLVKLGLASIDQYDVGKGMEDHLTPLWVLSDRLLLGAVFSRSQEAAVNSYQDHDEGRAVQAACLALPCPLTLACLAARSEPVA